ncbi:MAG: reductive dehalogenase [Paracoccaceae bacterium]|nr:reductive dehalogenase [Paracoccaceae bacterium]
MKKLLSYRNRPVHLGPYPLERLNRTHGPPNLDGVEPMRPLTFRRPYAPRSIVNAMGEYQAMLDAIREGLVKTERALIPDDPSERSNHLKSFGYFCDASMVGAAGIPESAWLSEAIVNPDVDRLSRDLRTRQVKSAASGIDVIMAMLKEAMQAPPTGCRHHAHVLVFLFEYPRDPEPGEPGCDWLADAQRHRAALRAAETASVLANYLRSLGREARAHSASASDLDLEMLAVQAGLACNRNGRIENPFLGNRFGLAAVSTTMALAHDKPLAQEQRMPAAWTWGTGRQAKSRLNRDPFRNRRFVDGPHPFESIRRVDKPTTYIDEDNVVRVPKRADMFLRALFGDLGKPTQDGARNGNYVRKTPASFAFRPPLGAFVLLQDGEAAKDIDPSTRDPATNAANVKATCYFLGCDAVGISRCPDWSYYSHNALGEPIQPYHDNAISFVIDQGHETMEGASGDDWISCAQSMRAYLRFSLLGGVIASQIRNLGYTARVHSVMDSDVVQPPLMLLSGLGEVSRIGEVILNPFLGPRLKAGTVTTSLPLVHDRPIDFGLQNFCESCNKCARECPSGAITAGPKLMFNGYEIWKSDSQKCATYRITTEGGAMCGRCMKTCPWNLEGLFAEAPFRWAASNLPRAARFLAKLDDWAGNGGINPVKTWWWDLEMRDEGPYVPAEKPANRRGLQTSLNLRFEDQTLAVYPANLVPPPYPWPFPMDREAAIEAHDSLVSAEEYRRRRRAGIAPEHRLKPVTGDVPVMRVRVTRADQLTPDITTYELRRPDGTDLPVTEPGAHVDVLIAPEFFRQYSLTGDLSDRSRYRIAVLREDHGRGGSRLMHRIFETGRMVFISKPINHFPLEETATRSFLMAGGIGITPLIAMAHRLHAIGADFELHYSCSSRRHAAFLSEVSSAPWSDRVTVHLSDEGTRADLRTILAWRPGAHVYACGPDPYMNAVLDQASAAGFPDENCHVEYFNVPEQPEWDNHDFILRLANTGQDIRIPAEKSATDALAEAGISVQVKCSDGLCGVCKCRLLSGEVEHRDYVLSKSQRQDSMILCQSRAAEADGIVEVAL